MMPPRNQKWLIILVLVLLGGVLLFLICATPPAFPAVTILPPGPLVVKSGRVPDRWIPAKWTWLHRACLFVLGAPRQAGFEIQFILDPESLASIITRNSLGQPQSESNGLAVWILPEGTLQPPSGAATLFISPLVLTPNRTTKRSVFGGYSAELFPRLESETIELSTRLIVRSAARTNFIAAVRAQLPHGAALFLVDVRQPDSATNRYEFLITADEYDAKGNKVHGKPGGK
jgi:hypothetical protein